MRTVSVSRVASAVYEDYAAGRDFEGCDGATGFSGSDDGDTRIDSACEAAWVDWRGDYALLRACTLASLQALHSRLAALEETIYHTSTRSVWYRPRVRERDRLRDQIADVSARVDAF